MDDVVETVNHFRLFDAMLGAVGQPLTAARVREYHAILKAGTSDADKDWFAVDGWKERANAVGGRDTTPPALVGAAVDGALLAAELRRLARCHDGCVLAWPTGRRWRVTEAANLGEPPPGDRIPAHRFRCASRKVETRCNIMHHI
ncbi:MAG: hypothetical protein LBK54_08665 [Propionibacteriaceae bacterium]|nr:hypothetical protein [Propionibacteriaceae bacterium]